MCLSLRDEKCVVPVSSVGLGIGKYIRIFFTSSRFLIGEIRNGNQILKRVSCNSYLPVEEAFIKCPLLDSMFIFSQSGN